MASEIRSTWSRGDFLAARTVNNSEVATALDSFYELLAELETACGGRRQLSEVDRRELPARGVYFFFENGETRPDASDRVVRVGTHALTRGSKTTLWNRLAQHRGHLGGSRPGGGNHRGSIFRHHIGQALIARDGWGDKLGAAWADTKNASPDVKEFEYPLERAVSAHLGDMPVLWIAVDDDPGPVSDRGVIESGAIALLSNQLDSPDPPSATWLGRSARRLVIQRSGLWNVRHVDEPASSAFLATFAARIASTAS